MKDTGKMILRYVAGCLLVLINSGPLLGSDSISITYIANCGFLIEMDSNKIVVDGLFRRGHNYYPTPDTGTQRLLVSNRPPFDDMDLILVTHVHEDHFDKEMVTACMLNNPSVKLLCPQQVIDSLRDNASVYDLIEPRIIPCTPDTFTSQSVRIGEIEIHACRLLHPGEKYRNVQNIAYLISVNGKSVFHSADIDPRQINSYRGIKPGDMDIDIGLINEDFVKIENAGLTDAFIHAKYNIAMHLPDSVAAGWLDSIRDKPDLFKNPFVFTRRMQKKVFYISTGPSIL